jgi:hypothetical protein
MGFFLYGRALVGTIEIKKQLDFLPIVEMISFSIEVIISLDRENISWILFLFIQR